MQAAPHSQLLQNSNVRGCQAGPLEGHNVRVTQPRQRADLTQHSTQRRPCGGRQRHQLLLLMGHTGATPTTTAACCCCSTPNPGQQQRVVMVVVVRVGGATGAGPQEVHNRDQFDRNGLPPPAASKHGAKPSLAQLAAQGHLSGKVDGEPPLGSSKEGV